MRFVKPLLVLLGALLLLAVIVIAVLVARFDAARIKAEIETVVAEKTGRKIRIDDPIGLSFYPDIALALGGVHLSEKGKHDQEFAAVERMRISVRLMPLLSKRVEAQQIELVGVKARVVVGKDGKRNIDDLARPTDPAATPVEAGKQAPSPRFEIAGVRIERAALSYLDERVGQNWALSDFSLSTGALANASSAGFKTAGKLSSKGIEAAFDGQGVYRYDLDAGSFGAEKLSLSLRGNVMGINGLDATLQAAAVNQRSAQDILVDRLTLNAKGKSGEDGFDLALDVPKLVLAEGKAGGDTAKLEARLAGKTGPLALTLQVADIKGSAESVQIGRLALKVDGKRGENTLSGNLNTAIRASLTGRTAELSKITGEVQVANPAMPMKSAKLGISGQAKVDWGLLKASGETAVAFDESTIQSRWEVSRFSPLALGFDVSIDRLNVDRYFPPAPKAAAASAPAAGKAPAAEAPLDLGALQGPEVRGTLRIGALQASNVKLAKLRTDLRLASGKLDVSAFDAALYDGKVSGTASVDSRGNRIALRQKLESISINPFLRDLADKDILEGRGNLTIDITTAGAGVAAMKRGLAGSAAISLKDGAIKGINLAKSFRELKAKLGSKQDVAQKASASDKTDFSEMSATFKIAGGVAHGEDLSAKSPFLRLAGAGDIDIGQSTINYLAKASIVNTSGGQEGKDLEHVKGMTIPVRLTGPFDNLAYKIEFGALVQEAVKAQVQEKVQQKVESKVGDKLKGLFKK